MSTSEPIRDNAHPERAAGVYVRDLDGEQVVYDPASHEIVVLNETAAFVFGLCDGTRSVVDLLRALEQRYDAPVDRLRSDLLAVLDDLRAKRLISG
jgi:hypothetical protein